MTTLIIGLFFIILLSATISWMITLLTTKKIELTNNRKLIIGLLIFWLIHWLITLIQNYETLHN